MNDPSATTNATLSANRQIARAAGTVMLALVIDQVAGLVRTTFSDLPLIEPGRIRKKSSVASHLPKGILAHRRSKQPALV